MNCVAVIFAGAIVCGLSDMTHAAESCDNFVRPEDGDVTKLDRQTFLHNAVTVSGNARAAAEICSEFRFNEYARYHLGSQIECIFGVDSAMQILKEEHRVYGLSKIMMRQDGHDTVCNWARGIRSTEQYAWFLAPEDE